LVLLVLCLGFFMILLDLTIVNIGIPSIIDGLHASLDSILWVLNAYILAYAVLLITAGRLGDMFGAKRLFLIGLAVFTLASIACSVAQSPAQLIAARIVQGIGGAILTPQTLSMITNIFPAEKRGAVFGVWGAVAGVASLAGPTLGGFLVTNYDWRAIFWINVPVGIVTFALGVWLLPAVKFGRAHSLDPVGVLLATAGLSALVFALIEGQRYHWGTFTDALAFDVLGGHWGLISIPALFLLSAILLAVFLIWERGQPEPLVPFSLFKERNFAIGNALSAIVSFGMLGLFLPLTIFLQSVLGFSAFKAGLTFAPMSLVSMVVAPISGRLTDRYGGKYILMLGLTLFGIGMGLVIALSALSADLSTYILPLIVAGVGLGCTFAPMTTVTMRRVEPRLAGAASGILNTIRQLGGAFGSAIVGAILQNRLASELVTQAQAQSGTVPAAFRSAFVQGFANAGNGALQVGRGQSGAALLPNVPPQAAAKIGQVAHDVFATAYLNAMRPALAVPIAVLLVGALLTTMIVRRKNFSQPVRQPAAVTG
ncbi:MAG: DHA2 family efflux MFS transporter permease subunit, partial [Candidatus Dormibacteraeota bacterium]|nr:DHA2 family efflux MFS transporter permease subunit [Candidatus Dormibacteraeota bacterium]